MGTEKENRRKIWGLVFCIVFLAVFAPCRKVQAAAELSKTYVILLMGQEGKDTYSMEVSGTGKGSKVEFSIKDASVAAVDEKGKISALSPGKTTLVCTVTDKEGKETVKKATVRVYDNIKAITLSVKDVEKNALHKNKSYALAYTCKTVAGTNKNIDNYIHYEVLSLEGKTVKDASVDAEGNFLAKSTGTYLVRACAFQSDQQYKKWEKDSEKYADYILAQDEIRVTVTTTNYKKTAHKIGDYTVNLPKDYELDIFEKGKERTAFSAMVEKDKLEENWKTAYNAKKASVSKLQIEKAAVKKREILEIKYRLTLRDIVIKGKEAADIKISRMDFVNTVYTWYEGNRHISVTVTDAQESLNPNISDVAFDIVEELLTLEEKK